MSGTVKKAAVWVAGSERSLGRPSASRAVDLELALDAQRDLGEKVFIGAINESVGETELFL